MLTITERQALVNDFISLANSLAWKKFKTTPKHISFDELQSAAYMGLVDAASRFDPTEYSSFQPHARIKGEMEDYLRGIQWGKRGEPVNTVAPDDDSAKNHFTWTPENNECESKDLIDKILQPLEPIARDIVIMHDIDERLLREIGNKYDLSPSRVHQILRKSHKTLEESCKTFLEVAA